MRAWTVDADDIRVAEDFDDALLDKPIGDKIFSRESIAVFASSPLPWSKVWLTAIALTVLKHTGAAEGLKVNARLAGLVADRQLHGVIDHFVRLLDFPPRELQRCATDTDGHLVPRLRMLKTQLQHDLVHGAWRQRFLRPGEATLDLDGALPRASHYLLHPVLLDVINRLQPASLQRLARANSVGYDRPWRDPDQIERQASVRTCCVLKGDVHAFGRLMRAGKDAPVRRALEAAAQRWAPASAITETGAGDAVLIADDDPVALAQTARHLMDEVYQAPGQPRLRIALHHGEVHSRQRESDLRAIIVGGQAILCAARVEPMVEPGQIWATEEFRQQFLQRPSLWRTTPLQPPGGGELFNVRKEGSADQDLWVRLHRLET